MLRDIKFQPTILGRLLRRSTRETPRSQIKTQERLLRTAHKSLPPDDDEQVTTRRDLKGRQRCAAMPRGKRRWCDVCRGDDDVLFGCSTCERAYHVECVRMTKPPDGVWRCDNCISDETAVEDEDEKQRRKKHSENQKQLNALKRHIQVAASLGSPLHPL